MYLKYGSYTHALNEAGVAIDRELVRAAGGEGSSLRERWTIEGMIQAADQASLTAALAALEAAYNTPNRDLGLYLDDGATATVHVLRASDAMKIETVKPVSYPKWQGGEYSTYRSFTVTVEGTVSLAEESGGGGGGQGGGLLAFEESIEFGGGGPLYGFLQVINGPPQKQLLAQATVFTASQRGSSTGTRGYPTASRPIWPAAYVPSRSSTSKESPKRSGVGGSRDFSEYPISWTYYFEDASPLVGNPNVWR